MAHSLRYLANCSIMFTELPLLRRPAAARAACFDAVEFWWPFDRPVPGAATGGRRRRPDRRREQGMTHMPAFAEAKRLRDEFRVPVVVEVILERVTNVSMGTELDGVVEFEDLAATSADAPTAIALLD